MLNQVTVKFLFQLLYSHQGLSKEYCVIFLYAFLQYVLLRKAGG